MTDIDFSGIIFWLIKTLFKFSHSKIGYYFPNNLINKKNFKKEKEKKPCFNKINSKQLEIFKKSFKLLIQSNYR